MAVPYSARTGGLTKVLWILAPLALFAVVVVRFTELSALLDVFAGASRRWLFAAGLLTAGYIVSQAGVYRGLFRLLGVAVAFVDAVSLFLVMAFASMALPAWTATGICLLRRGSACEGRLRSAVPARGARLLSV